MRVVINCRSILNKNRTGIGRYTHNLIIHLSKAAGRDRFVLYAQKKLFDFKRKLPPIVSPHISAHLDYFGFGIPSGDVYHLPSPGMVGHFKGKVVVTVHDMIYKTFPQGHTPQTIDMTSRFMEHIAQRADHIICVSQSTRQDFHAHVDYPLHKTSVVLNGVDQDVFYRMDDLSCAAAFLKNKGLEPGFILFVGTIEPRKNLMGLVEALARLKQDHPPLVVAGMQGWMNSGVEDMIEAHGLKDKVIFTGFINDEELNFLYNACGIFVFPSFYEGFGFPILEAMSAGAAVIASNRSSCPEIIADAGITFDPADSQALSGEIQKLLDDADMRKALKQKAWIRSKAFSFAKMAEETLSTYHHAWKG